HASPCRPAAEGDRTQSAAGLGHPVGIDGLRRDRRRARLADAQPAWWWTSALHDAGDVRSTIGPLQCAHSSAWIEHRATDPGAGVQILLGAFFLRDAANPRL